MKNPNDIAKEKTIKNRVFIFSFVMTFLSTTTRWVCLLDVLQPQAWMLATNVARWVWIAVYIVPLIVGLTGLLFSRIAASSKLRSLFMGKNLGLFLTVLVVGALLIDRLITALVLSYIWTATESARKLRASSEEADGKAQRFQQIDNVFALLSCSLFAPALALHSLPLTVALFVAEVVRFLIGIPQAKYMLKNQSLNQK